MATTTKLASNENAIYNALQRQMRLRRLHGAEGVFLLPKIVLTLATTEIDNADDAVNVVTMPSTLGPIILLDFWIDSDDLDTNVTPLHAADWKFTTAGTLISASAACRTGARDDMDADSAVKGKDIAGDTLVFDTTAAAATPAAGDITIWMLVHVGEAITPLNAD